MVASDGTSFRFFEQKGFKRLTKGIQEALNCTVNRSNVVEWSDEAAATVRAKIAEELRCRLINITIDAATRFNRSVLGITAQYIHNGKIQHRGLSVMEIMNRHTASNILDELLLVLATYQIKSYQVYSWSSDNASNMLNAAALLSDHQRRELSALFVSQTDCNTGNVDETDNIDYGK